jgi:Asp/Glu/hydantoin racemase
MDKNKKILFLAHCLPDDYVYKDTARYLERFPDVELTSASKYADKPFPHFPRSYKELTFEEIAKFGPVYDQPFLDAMQAAEREGYGAVATPSYGDPGVALARGKVSIPCVGMAWAGYTKAREVGGKFSVLHNHLPELIPLFSTQIGAYGFSENLVSIEQFDVDVYQWLANEEKPNYNELVGIALPLVKRSVEKGAKVMLIACGSPELSEFAPILDKVTMKEYNIPVLTSIDTVIDVARKLMKEREGIS